MNYEWVNNPFWVEIPYSIVTFSLPDMPFTWASFEHDKFFSVFFNEKLVMLPHSNEQIKLVKLKIAKENLLLGCYFV